MPPYHPTFAFNRLTIQKNQRNPKPFGQLYFLIVDKTQSTLRNINNFKFMAPDFYAWTILRGIGHPEMTSAIFAYGFLIGIFLIWH